ncbi:hypothetical protein KAJ89_05050 [Candidatus Parcubacteria bacterium]|nr:hypothetical protein [Candidatus Parcubacteria bacterium]
MNKNKEYSKIIFALILLILIPTTALAWNDCPYNETDCPSPGECSRYIDTDNDKICDWSQLPPKDRDNGIYGIINLESENKQSKIMYHLLPISLLLIIFYAITHILSRKKIISIVNHRKIWNVLLLISFLISGILGILLIIKINFNIINFLPFNALFWHVETGIAMFIICVIHIIERRYYFKNLFKK